MMIETFLSILGCPISLMVDQARVVLLCSHLLPLQAMAYTAATLSHQRDTSPLAPGSRSHQYRNLSRALSTIHQWLRLQLQHRPQDLSSRRHLRSDYLDLLLRMRTRLLRLHHTMMPKLQDRARVHLTATHQHQDLLSIKVVVHRVKTCCCSRTSHQTTMFSQLHLKRNKETSSCGQLRHRILKSVHHLTN